MHRGSMAPEVFTEGTMCLVTDIDGYRIVYRDSGGPVSKEERSFFAARRQLKQATMPLIETYQPRAVIPCHHDDLYPVPGRKRSPRGRVRRCSTRARAQRVRRPAGQQASPR